MQTLGVSILPDIAHDSGLPANRADKDVGFREALNPWGLAGRQVAVVDPAAGRVAIAETVRHLGCNLSDIRVLSIRTAAAPHVVRDSAKQAGLLARFDRQ